MSSIPKALDLCLSSRNITECDFNPDNVFNRFKVLEFPISFVGLSTKLSLHVNVDLSTSAYLKTMYNGKLMKFDEVREVSASHRAFEIVPISNKHIVIIFKPRTECISKAKSTKQFNNRFVFDLRLIKVDGVRCCNNECHSEIGRYYICGQFDYCNISNYPKVINFGDVTMNSKMIKDVYLKNESGVLSAKVEYMKVVGFEVSPQKFTIKSNSSQRLFVTVKPTHLMIPNTLKFKIKNPHHYPIDENTDGDDNNFISYTIECKINIVYQGHPREIETPSLHKLNEQNPNYAFLGEELHKHTKNKQITETYFKKIKISNIIKPVVAKRYKIANCFSMLTNPIINANDFCINVNNVITTYDLPDILFIPFLIDFGRVALSTYAEQELDIQNNTKHDIIIKFLNDDCVLYTEEKSKNAVVKLKSYTKLKITIFGVGFIKGNLSGTFEYIIDDKYFRKHPYFLQVGSPTLLINDKSLKFGMVTNECFITSVPVKIYNYFNIPIKFEWNEMNSDNPFEIIPNSGCVPSHTCKICDVTYNYKASKTKTHEVDFVCHSKPMKVIPLEFSIITRKLSIKFLQPSVNFKDIALNIETTEKVKLENSSREIAVFYIMEPLMPGFRIKPMCGNILPKMIMTFDIIVKISCVLEFAFDICLKINNKEYVILPVSGNVVEPKLLIHPKYVYMARVPCGMITYVPITFQNTSTLKTVVEVLDTNDENIFKVFAARGNEKERVFEFHVEAGQSKTMLIKIHDVFRREYEMYMPFKINRLLGPPDQNPCSVDFQHYIGEYEQQYENNPKVKIRTFNKDISFCRITGVITVPWIKLSVEKFEIDYLVNANNTIEFTMQNISKYNLYITILTSKLSPYFTLDLVTQKNDAIINEMNIKFELDRHEEAAFKLTFCPKSHGRFVSTAVLYLDKNMTIPYYNLTFIGRRQSPNMTPEACRIIFPPCYVGTTVDRKLTLQLELASEKDLFSCHSKEEPNLTVEFIDSEVIPINEGYKTIVRVNISVCSQSTYARYLTLNFSHVCGSSCEVDVSFCFTYCPLTLHTNLFVTPDKNPYPYFPLSSQTQLFEYLETCSKFLEIWMFQQGFRRDLYPVIPDTFHAISSSMSSQTNDMKSKGNSVSYLNFVRRIAGPLMKHIRKTGIQGHEQPFRGVKEIHDTYKEIIHLLKSRGANLWILQAKFLLSFDQFVIYTQNVTAKCNADIILIKELLDDVNLFNRLNKQCWIDFILQSYKVFVMDSCFFDCVCISFQPRDIIKVLLEWYNKQIMIQHSQLRGKDKPIKIVSNVTTDLSDGVALISALINYCPFMKDHFACFCEVTDDKNKEGAIVHNACLVIDAMNQLRLYFPLNSKDLLEPNFLQMLFLSIHLYVTLPMFKPKDVVKFKPPLLRSSTRQIAIAPSSQESLIFSYMILNNVQNNFVVEKAPSVDNGKKIFLSVKYSANFVNAESCILIVHGYNKTRIFDTYIVFILYGHIGSLNPVRKSKVIAPLYRPNKVDVLVTSPFATNATFDIYITDNEPTIPVNFKNITQKRKFCVRRLNLIDKVIFLSGIPKESGQEVQEHKLYLQMICLSTQVGNTWIWFLSDVGHFFIRVTTQPRWDLAIDTLQAKIQAWPIDPYSSGEAFECCRTTILMVPYRNELMVKALRYALLENASDIMMQVFDNLIETTTGKVILGMLLNENGTNMSDVQHILRSEISYRITSKALIPRFDYVTLAHHSLAMLPVPVTVPAQYKFEKYSLTFTSDCGMDIRTYRVIFIETSSSSEFTTLL